MDSFEETQEILISLVEEKRLELLKPYVVGLLINRLNKINNNLVSILFKIIDCEDESLENVAKDEILDIWSCLNEIETLFKDEIFAIKLSILRIRSIRNKLPLSERKNHHKYVEHLLALIIDESFDEHIEDYIESIPRSNKKLLSTMVDDFESFDDQTN